MPGMRCAVAVCCNSRIKTKNDPSKLNIRYHSFPKNPAIRKIWVTKCKRNTKFNPLTSHICSEHFNEDSYERDLKAELLGLPNRQALKIGAVPTEKLRLDTVLPIRPSEATERELRILKKQRKEFVENILAESEKWESVLLKSTGTSGKKKKQSTKNNDKSEQLESAPSISGTNDDDLIECLSTQGKPDSPKRPDTIINKGIGNLKLFERINSLEKRCTFLENSRSTMIKRGKNKSKIIKDLRTEIKMKNLVCKRALKELKILKNEKNKKAQLNSKLADILREVFSESQIKKLLGKKSVIWGVKDLVNAFTLLCCSKKAYLFLKKDLKFPLPGLSTLRAYNSRQKRAVLIDGNAQPS